MSLKDFGVESGEWREVEKRGLVRQKVSEGPAGQSTHPVLGHLTGPNGHLSNGSGVPSVHVGLTGLFRPKPGGTPCPHPTRQTLVGR